MLQRNKINILPKNIADKIAAGEIVDRPLSIIKELLENAIDAGADSIIVEIKNGGKSYIRVTDNGCGIPKEEVSLAFQRHATSKILTQKDLFSINTLGFRGEALASIGAVSHIELITKTHEEKMGSRIVIQGSQIVEQSDTGCPNGTTVIVTNLFYNTPVRLKFLKNDAAESTPIIDFVSKMALAYPFTRIRLINNGSILFSTLGKGSIYTNILTIYSKELGTELLQIEKNEGDY
jgi:DNA mismatch repair protein MutL